MVMNEKKSEELAVAARIRSELERHLMEGDAPDEVHDFLLGHWARLMLAIYMAKGNHDPDWQAGWDTANALIWSLAPKSGRAETEKMLRVLPVLLARLQEGCAALGLPMKQRDGFFRQLAMLHASVARDGLHIGPSPNSDLTKLAHGSTQEANEAELAALSVPPQDGSATSNQRAMPKLKLGDKVSFEGNGERRVLILHWVSPMGGMYLFTNSHGLEALTLTRTRLEAKLRSGEARQGG